MTKEMYEDLLERNRLQISELNVAKLEIEKLEKQNAELKEAVCTFKLFIGYQIKSLKNGRRWRNEYVK